MNNSKPNFALIGLIALLLVAGVIAFLTLRADTSQPVVEAPVLPEAETEEVPASWEAYTDEASGITFRYPKELSTTYIHATEWPPVVSVNEKAYTCDVQTTGGIKTREAQIDGVLYCVTETGEGAAGSIFTEYRYSTEREGRLMTLSFTLRSTQCGNYDEAQMQACTIERESFNPDTLVGQIVETLETK